MSQSEATLERINSCCFVNPFRARRAGAAGPSNKRLAATTEPQQPDTPKTPTGMAVTEKFIGGGGGGLDFVASTAASTSGGVSVQSDHSSLAPTPTIPSWIPFKRNGKVPALPSGEVTAAMPPATRDSVDDDMDNISSVLDALSHAGRAMGEEIDKQVRWLRAR